MIDFFDDDAFNEPEFIKLHRDEFENFVYNRPDLAGQSARKLHLEFEEDPKMPHYAQSQSPIPSLNQPKRCSRFVRNFGPHALHLFKQRESLDDVFVTS